MSRRPSERESAKQLNPAAKRLMLSAHLGLMCKKLRRGLCVEEQEILALLPFTVSNGFHPKDETPPLSAEDLDWSERVASAGALP